MPVAVVDDVVDLLADIGSLGDIGIFADADAVELGWGDAVIGGIVAAESSSYAELASYGAFLGHESFERVLVGACGSLPVNLKTFGDAFDIGGMDVGIDTHDGAKGERVVVERDLGLFDFLWVVAGVVVASHERFDAIGIEDELSLVAPTLGAVERLNKKDDRVFERDGVDDEFVEFTFFHSVEVALERMDASGLLGNRFGEAIDGFVEDGDLALQDFGGGVVGRVECIVLLLQLGEGEREDIVDGIKTSDFLLAILSRERQGNEDG